MRVIGACSVTLYCSTASLWVLVSPAERITDKAASCRQWEGIRATKQRPVIKPRVSVPPSGEEAISFYILVSHQTGTMQNISEEFEGQV